jgi:hypothetical protein
MTTEFEDAFLALKQAAQNYGQIEGQEGIAQLSGKTVDLNSQKQMLAYSINFNSGIIQQALIETNLMSAEVAQEITLSVFENAANSAKNEMLMKYTANAQAILKSLEKGN